MVSVFETITPMAADRGTTSKHRRIRVITVTAAHRRPQSQDWIFIIRGQVAATMVEAQMIAGRKGSRIHRDIPIRETIKSALRMVRVRSFCFSATIDPPISHLKDIFISVSFR